MLVETWEHWREAVEGEGLAFTAAQEYKTFPPPPAGSDDGASAADAALALLPLMEEERFDVVVSDILTLAPALAAERAGLRRATLIPHVFPVHEPGLPFFAFGALPARTAVGRALWRGGLPVLTAGLRRGRDEYNESRAVVGLAPTERLHGGISEQLALVATFPQLEYPRRWPDHVHVTGPMASRWRIPMSSCREGDGPLVLVAPSTAQDPECRLVRVALEGLADEPVRVLATTNRHAPEEPLPPAPANAVVVEWLSYSQAMAAADLVICHGGHGTVARALGAGAPVLCCPAVGDMAENGRAGRVVGHRADAAVAAGRRGVAAAGGAEGARGSVAERRGRPRSRRGPANTTARSEARSWSRSWREPERKDPQMRAFELRLDSNHTPWLTVEAAAITSRGIDVTVTQVSRGGGRGLAVELKVADLHGRMAVGAQEDALLRLLPSCSIERRDPAQGEREGLLARILVVKLEGGKTSVIAADPAAATGLLDQLGLGAATPFGDPVHPALPAAGAPAVLDHEGRSSRASQQIAKESALAGFDGLGDRLAANEMQASEAHIS